LRPGLCSRGLSVIFAFSYCVFAALLGPDTSLSERPFFPPFFPIFYGWGCWLLSGRCARCFQNLLFPPKNGPPLLKSPRVALCVPSRFLPGQFFCSAWHNSSLLASAARSLLFLTNPVNCCVYSLFESVAGKAGRPDHLTFSSP